MIRPVSYDPWEAVLLISSFLLLSAAYTFNKKNIQRIFIAFFSNRYFSQIREEEQLFGSFLTITLTLVFTNNLALFIITLLKIAFHVKFSIALYLTLFFNILLYYFLKFLAIKIIGFLYQTDKAADNHIYHIFLFNSVVAVLLTIFLVISYFSYFFATKHIFIISIISACLIIIHKAFQILFQDKYTANLPVFYNVLYFCSLEILPLVVIIKILVERF